MRVRLKSGEGWCHCPDGGRMGSQVRVHKELRTRVGSMSAWVWVKGSVGGLAQIRDKLRIMIRTKIEVEMRFKVTFQIKI
jgi:hypothetical protein